MTPRVAPRFGKIVRGVFRRWALLCLLAAAACAMEVQFAAAENSDPAALEAVKAAVAAELHANTSDLTPWMYRDHDIQPGKDSVEQVVETPKGDLHRTLMLNGKPLTEGAEEKELERIRTFVNSPEEQAKRRRAAESDSKQAREFLSMLPNAFVWTIVKETPQTISLKYHPNSAFDPPDMQARVLGVMAGEMTIARNGNRIQSLRGTLTDEVKFGLGLFGKIDRGGTFNVERRELAPGKWQITETHVHIGGHALLFKTIGQQEDEVKTDWHLSPAPDLQTALQILEKVSR